MARSVESLKAAEKALAKSAHQAVVAWASLEGVSPRLSDDVHRIVTELSATYQVVARAVSAMEGAGA